MRTLHRCLAPALLCLALQAVPSVAVSAPPREEARKLFKSGNSLFRQGKYAAALRKYRAAKALLPTSYKIDLNIADTLFAMGQAHHPEAARYYERFLAAADGKPVAEAIRDNARARMDALLSTLASLRVDCTEQGASVEVDGRVVGQVPLKTRVYLTPSRQPRAVRVHFGDLEPFFQQATLAAGEHLIIKVVFSERAADPTGADSPLAPRPTPAQGGETVEELSTDPPPPEVGVYRGPEAPPQADTPASGPFVLALAGPAWTDYGDPSLTVGTAVEAGLQGGYHWRAPLGLTWLGLQAHGLLLYTPVRDANVADSSGFVSIAAGGGARFHVWRLWFDLGLSAGFGGTTLTTNGHTKLFVAKIDKAGKFLWAMGYGGSSSVGGSAIAVDPTGGKIFVAGWFAVDATFGSTQLTSGGGLVARFDGNGLPVWAVSAKGVSSGASIAIAGSDVAVAGAFSSSATFGATSLTSKGQHDVFVTRVGGNTGAFAWAEGLGGSGSDSGAGVGADATGNVYVAGSFEGTATFGATTLISGGKSDGFVTKLSGAGAVAWAKAVTGPNWISGRALAVDAQGNSHVAGTCNGATYLGTIGSTCSAGDEDAFAGKLDTSGKALWLTATGGAGSAVYPFAAALDSAGNAFVAGRFDKTATFCGSLVSAGSSDVFVWRLDKNGI